MKKISKYLQYFVICSCLLSNIAPAFAALAVNGNKPIIKNAEEIRKNNQIADFKEDTSVALEDYNPLIDTLCQVIIFMQGRTGRAIALGMLFSMGIMFFLGKITWPQIVTFGIGLAILFGAKNIALMILPYYIMDESNAEITTDEAIKKVCPEI